MASSNQEEALLIRTDAADTTGTGHVMHMLALEQAWQDRAGSVSLGQRCDGCLVSTRVEILPLIDYGFSYHRDPVFPQDDITWFLMERKR